MLASQLQSGASTELPGIAQLLDEHHLVVLGDDPVRRRRFASALACRLESISASHVIRISGSTIGGMTALCGQLEEWLDPEPPRASTGEPTADADLARLVALLRGSRAGSDRRAPRLQFFLWDDADAMLDADVTAFGDVVQAFLAVAAEREHVSPDRLVLQRLVLFGGDKLGACAEDPASALRGWRPADDETGHPFAAVTAVVARPPVLTYRLDG